MAKQTVRVPPEVARELCRVAALAGLPLETVVRAALAYWGELALIEQQQLVATFWYHGRTSHETAAPSQRPSVRHTRHVWNEAAASWTWEAWCDQHRTWFRKPGCEKCKNGAEPVVGWLHALVRAIRARWSSPADGPDRPPLRRAA